MERNFVLSCCSTVDLPYAYMARRDIPVLFYHYVVGDQDYVCLLYTSPSPRDS